MSVDLTVNFINTANNDDEILIISEVNKVGKNIAFSSAKILNLSNNKIIATGSHTKAFLNQSMNLWIIIFKRYLIYN